MISLLLGIMDINNAKHIKKDWQRVITYIMASIKIMVLVYGKRWKERNNNRVLRVVKLVGSKKKSGKSLLDVFLFCLAVDT